MNEVPPPLPPLLPPRLPASAPPKKSDKSALPVVLIVVGVLFAGIFLIGLLAAIAIPNFVRARKTAQMNLCINNLRLIESAKQQWALENKKSTTDTPTQDEVVVLLRNQQFPVCPAGGVYTIGAGDEEPTCSIPEHTLAGRSASPNR